MKKYQIILLTLIFFANFSLAQENTKKDFLYSNLSFGFETNDGNTGILVGAGYQRNLTRKLIFQTDLHYYTTEIVTNKWQYEKAFPKEERYERSTFLSAMLGYAFVGKTDKFNIAIKGGLSLFHIKQKSRADYQAIFYPEGNSVPYSDPGFIMNSHSSISPYTGEIVKGTGIVDPLSVTYRMVNKVEYGFNFGLDVNIPIKKKHFITVGFLSYSSDTFLQYIFCPIPVISYKLKL